jgi:hypothetical protein
MPLRRGLIWVVALALLVAVTPVASSVADDVGKAVLSTVDKKQNKRLDKQARKLKQHSAQLKALQAADYGVARGYMATDTDRLEAIKGSVLVTSAIPQDGKTRAMASRTFTVDRAEGDVGVRIIGAIAGGGKGAAIGAAIGAGGAGTYAVCAPAEGDTCAGGSVAAGETVCSIKAGAYDSGTGVLTLVGIPRKSFLAAGALPAPTDVDIGGGTCELPGEGRYNVFVSVEFQEVG